MYIKCYMYKSLLKSMSTHVVKARFRHGTKSLDLTIPVKIATSMKINKGDVFSIEAKKNKNGKLMLLYTRILESS